MDRRTVLKGGVVLAVSAHSPVASRVEAGVSQSRSTLDALFVAHAAAVRDDDEAWDEVSVISDGEAMANAPTPKVEVARQFLGRDDQGKDMHEPVFAYDEEKIREVYKRHDMYSMPGKPGLLWDPDGSRRAAHYQRMDAKIGELHAQEAEVKRIEHECGYTAAKARAHETSEAVQQLDDAIIEYVPRTLNEAAAKARWILNEIDCDCSYLRQSKALLTRVLRSFEHGART